MIAVDYSNYKAIWPEKSAVFCHHAAAFVWRVILKNKQADPSRGRLVHVLGFT
jgi:hypothetical protein